jgi:hypothetical protein
MNQTPTHSITQQYVAPLQRAAVQLVMRRNQGITRNWYKRQQSRKCPLHNLDGVTNGACSVSDCLTFGSALKRQYNRTSPVVLCLNAAPSQP